MLRVFNLAIIDSIVLEEGAKHLYPRRFLTLQDPWLFFYSVYFKSPINQNMIIKTIQNIG